MPLVFSKNFKPVCYNHNMYLTISARISISHYLGAFLEIGIAIYSCSNLFNQEVDYLIVDTLKFTVRECQIMFDFTILYWHKIVRQ